MSHFRILVLVAGLCFVPVQTWAGDNANPNDGMQITVKKNKPVAAKKKAAPKLAEKRKYKSLYCLDGYIVKNRVFCAITKAPEKAAKPVAKKSKVQRSIASKKEINVKR